MKEKKTIRGQKGKGRSEAQRRTGKEGEERKERKRHDKTGQEKTA